MAVENDLQLYARAMRRERVFRDRGNPLEMSDEELMERFRFSQRGISFLVDLLNEQLTNITDRSFAVPTVLCITTALHFLASGCFQRITGDSFHIGLSQPTVSVCITKFLRAILSFTNTFIKFPVTEDEIRKNSVAFYNMKKIPKIIGLIDGTHIRIISPAANEDHYVNRKGFHSINVQIICNHMDRIINIVAKWPGSVHDSTILRQSPLWQYFEEPNQGIQRGMLLGDSGYPCKNWLLTPYREPLASRKQELFNR